MSVRLGAVSYLNSQPIVLPLETERQFEVAYSVPAQCARDLEAGKVDVGLIPSIEYARGSDPYRIVPDVAIASHGPVLTVRLFWKGDFGRIGRIALDLSSRTSVALLQILLAERHNMVPAWVDMEPDLDAMLGQADAALIIGDPVFGHLADDLNFMDLGAEWSEWTALPFVYAFWAGRPEALQAEEVAALVRARAEGAASIPQIAADFARRRGGEAEVYEQYLTENIHFAFGDREKEGLQLFLRLAYQHDLIPARTEVQFFQVAAVPAHI